MIAMRFRLRVLCCALASAAFIGCEKDATVPVERSSFTTDDGMTYRTLIIGDEEWMAENLKTNVFCNGDEIQAVTVNSQWTNATGAATSVYRNNANNEPIYGRLYNAAAVNDERGVCPCGWRVPQPVDWAKLIERLDQDAQTEVFGVQSPIAGGALKAIGTVESGDGLWQRANTGATDLLGFSGLPAGCRSRTGAYHSIGNAAFFWTSQQRGEDEHIAQYLAAGSAGISKAGYPMNSGFSIRCMRSL